MSRYVLVATSAAPTAGAPETGGWGGADLGHPDVASMALPRLVGQDGEALGAPLGAPRVVDPEPDLVVARDDHGVAAFLRVARTLHDHRIGIREEQPVPADVQRDVHEQHVTLGQRGLHGAHVAVDDAAVLPGAAAPAVEDSSQGQAAVDASVLVTGRVGPQLVERSADPLPPLECAAQCRPCLVVLAVVELGELVQHPPADRDPVICTVVRTDEVVDDRSERESGALEAALMPGRSDRSPVGLVSHPCRELCIGTARHVREVAVVGCVGVDAGLELLRVGTGIDTRGGPAPTGPLAEVIAAAPSRRPRAGSRPRRSFGVVPPTRARSAGPATDGPRPPPSARTRPTRAPLRRGARRDEIGADVRRRRHGATVVPGSGSPDERRAGLGIVDERCRHLSDPGAGLVVPVRARRPE
jgi:hypothetical protein